MKKISTHLFAAVVLSIVMILIVPLPPWLLDVLLALNIFGCALVLLMSVTITDPLEFSAFAPALLIATLFRLSLDVSATRLILTQGHLPGGVGSIIPAFGAFVVRGNLVVGLIVFAILVTIQFIVIAQGSQRVAEVAARFTLDAMPGKQMAIDADVHAGTIDGDAARQKRALVQKEADFYGAMDGAGKFVKGDAIAALVIVVLNLAGGVVVGMAYHGMSPGDAINAFALLSIGNALVTTLPAFLMSISMGMMVTRVAADGSLGFDLASQIFARPEILRSGGVLVLLLAFVPALPRPVFLLLGLCAFAAAHFSARAQSERLGSERALAQAARRNAIRRPEMALGLVGVDAISIELGADLAPLLVVPLAEQFLDRIGEVRRALAAEIGVVLPGVRLRDDLAREPVTYAIRVRDELAGEGTIFLDKVLAVADRVVLEGLAGEERTEPVYGLPAKWIDPPAREAAMRAGALVFDPISVIGSHLAEVARENAPALVGRQELQTLLEHLRATVPALVKEIGSDALPLATLHKTFALLLRERAWPRDPVAALEAIVDSSAHTREPRDLAEAARRAIVPQLLRRRNTTVLEALIVGAEVQLRTEEPEFAVAIRRRVEAYRQEVPRERSALVCTATLRPLLADFLLRCGLRIPVYSYSELPPQVQLLPAGVLNDERAAVLAS